MNVSFPLRFDGRGRTGSAEEERHIHDLIAQVLFTSPGERVNRPTFGAGVMQLLFAPGSPELAATTQLLVQSALQQWLGDLIQVESVVVSTQESILLVEVDYVVRRTQERQSARFRREVS